MSTGGTQLAGITTASMERSVIETKGPIRYNKQFESNPYMIC